MKEDVGKSISYVSTEICKTYDDMGDAFKWKIKEDLVGK